METVAFHDVTSGVVEKRDDCERWALFDRRDRPAVGVSLRPMEEICGATREHALAYLKALKAAAS